MERIDTGQYRVYFDGSSFGKGRRGGPGPSAGAAVLIDPWGRQTVRSEYIRSGDSDMAEYRGLLCGLQTALEHDVKSLKIYGDSRNIIDQMLGIKVVKKVTLIELRDLALASLTRFSHWEIHWIPRKRNELADAEARLCIERGRCTVEV